MVVLSAACSATQGAMHGTPAAQAAFHTDLAKAGDGSPFYRIPALAVSPFTPA